MADLWVRHGAFIALCAWLILTPQEDAAPQSLYAHRDTIGDTIVVRTFSGSLWSDSIDVTQELCIGATHDSDQLTFGRVTDIAVGTEGDLYVLDIDVPVIRHFSNTGQYLGDIGRKGQGRGEYGYPLGVETLPSGVVAVWDPRKGAVHNYTDSGRFITEWQVRSNTFTRNAFFSDLHGNLYVKTTAGDLRPFEYPQEYLLKIDHNGKTVDSIALPRLEGADRRFQIPTLLGPRTNFIPGVAYDLSPDGNLVRGHNSHYSIRMPKPDGSHVLIVRDLPRVNLQPGELAEWQTLAAQIGQRAGRSIPIPQIKPFFRELLVSSDGRVWISRHTRASRVAAELLSSTAGADSPRITWLEPTVFDVFKPDGTFLGSVHIPIGVQIYEISGMLMWGIRNDRSCGNCLVRLRIVRQ